MFVFVYERDRKQKGIPQAYGILLCIVSVAWICLSNDVIWRFINCYCTHKTVDIRTFESELWTGPHFYFEIAFYDIRDRCGTEGRRRRKTHGQGHTSRSIFVLYLVLFDWIPLLSVGEWFHTIWSNKYKCQWLNDTFYMHRYIWHSAANEEMGNVRRDVGRGGGHVFYFRANNV